MLMTDTRQTIKDSIVKAVQLVDDNYEGLILAALYISFNQSYDEIRIYRIDQKTDEEILILTHKISPCEDTLELDRHTVYERVEDIVNKLDSENAFYPIRRYTPFSIYYVDKQSGSTQKVLRVSEDYGDSSSTLDDMVDLFDGLF